MLPWQVSGSNIFALVVLLAFAAGNSVSLAADSTRSEQAAIHSQRSAHFIVHTDFAPSETEEMLQRMEATLDSVYRYWKRPPKGLIECYVVDDSANWSPEDLPHPMAHVMVEQIGGWTLIERARAGSRNGHKAIVIAASRPGIAEHEAVHAYCGQTFGTSGPTWYREGMAQVMAHGAGKGPGVHCPQVLLDRLKASKPRTIHQVVNSGAFTEELSKSLAKRVTNNQRTVGFAPAFVWSEADAQQLEAVNESYAWSWLACHLLSRNPNYSSRFESVGQDYLGKRTETFAQVFQPVTRELEFEYNFMLQHVGSGYRADLCSWDWEKQFACAQNGRRMTARIRAARGYQASGLFVRANHRYYFSSKGQWNLGDQSDQVDADGDNNGRGCLQAVIMQDYQLCTPFDLGQSGRFVAPCNGRLYLRCRDEWTELGDNNGSIVVTLSRNRIARR